MAFQLENKDSRDLDSERIFFEDLSPEAQKKALALQGIADYRDANWDIMPLVYYYEPISNLSQSEIDDEALYFLKNIV
ncbi:hypothetical protein [Sulfurimonas sp. NW9]|uniref:hypothetical protein n=1 Tax=Sulfurimonas sp. NW9 TaxID=2922728 RepID=UPI003DAA1B73